MLRLLDPTDKSKYVELLHSLLLKPNLDLSKKDDEYKYMIEKECDEYINERYQIDEKRTSSMNVVEKRFLANLLSSYISKEDYKIIKDFMEINERKLINVDITKINNISELANLITLAEVKKNEKDSEKSVKVLLRNDKWLVLRPLSYESSIKYGKATKWCTTSSDPYHFYRYSKRGILIYIINLETGNKTGFFHNISNSDEHETSFWNTIDHRVDSIETDLDYEVLDILKKEMNEHKVTNYSLFSDIEKNNYNKLMASDVKVNTPVMEYEQQPQLDIIEEPNQPDFGESINLTGNFTFNTTGTATVVHMGDTWVTNTTLDVERD